MIITRARMSIALANARSRLTRLAHGGATSVMLGVGLTMASQAQAAGASMPWETPLQSILDSVQGPVAKVVGVIIIVVTGLTLAFGDSSGGFWTCNGFVPVT